MGLALVSWQLPTLKLSSTPGPCSVRQWVWAPPLSLHHPRQLPSTPGRVGREHPAGSIPSSGEGSLLARTPHTLVLRCLLPWAPSSGSSVWGGQRGQPGSHRRLDSWVPPSPRPETPEVELALDEAVCEISWKVPLPQKSLSTQVVSRGFRGEAGVRQGRLSVSGGEAARALVLPRWQRGTGEGLADGLENLVFPPGPPGGQPRLGPAWVCGCGCGGEWGWDELRAS